MRADLVAQLQSEIDHKTGLIKSQYVTASTEANSRRDSYKITLRINSDSAETSSVIAWRALDALQKTINK